MPAANHSPGNKVRRACADPTFSDILFGILDQSVGPSGILVSTGDVLPVANTINAQFVYDNMPAGQAWREVWYYAGLKVSESQSTWKDAANGKLTVNAAASDARPLDRGGNRARAKGGGGNILEIAEKTAHRGARRADDVNRIHIFRLHSAAENIRARRQNDKRRVGRPRAPFSKPVIASLYAA